MTDINELVDDYFAMWNEADPAARSAIAERVWEQEARYVARWSSPRGVR